MHSLRLLIASSCFLVLLSTVAASAAPQNTVFWISVDGLRPDYLDRADIPFFDKLQSNGAYGDQIAPVFPSITFSSHVSQATGVKPEKHGITGNSFYDSATQRTYRYPGWANLLGAEPIWTTATRQGVRAAVLDWPLAHSQRGPHTSAYFGERFERGLADEERLARVLDLWENDDDEKPLRLIMGYTTSPDTEGHRYGPDSPEVIEAVEKVDRILARAFDRAFSIWNGSRPGPEDRFFFVITSDHGMTEVTTLIHPGNLTGLEGKEDAIIITTGNVAHVHLDRMANEADRRRTIDQTIARLSEFDYVRAFPREEIPEEWGYRHPTRTGDIVLVLDNGLTFSRRPNEIEQPAKEAGGPLGMHGYDPASNPEMLTPLFIFRAPEPIGGERIGKADSLQMHATISKLLGIEPAAEAVQEAIEWDVVPAR